MYSEINFQEEQYYPTISFYDNWFNQKDEYYPSELHKSFEESFEESLHKEI